MTSERLRAFADAEKAKVSLADARMVCRIESRAIVDYLEGKDIAFESSADRDMPRRAVQRGVYGKFADDAQYGVEHIVRQFSS